MSWIKVYSGIYWRSKSSEETPINKNNLYKMDAQEIKIGYNTVNSNLVTVTPIDKMVTVTTSTTTFDTGLYVDIPLDAYFVVTATAFYDYGQCQELTLHRTTYQGTVISIGVVSSGTASATVSGFTNLGGSLSPTSNGLRIVASARYNNASQNRIYLRGFYIL